MQAAIEWLNSPEGLRWSMQHHFQSGHAWRMFCLKNDSDYIPQNWVGWGRVDKMGRYHKPFKRPTKYPRFNYEIHANPHAGTQIGVDMEAFDGPRSPAIGMA